MTTTKPTLLLLPALLLALLGAGFVGTPSGAATALARTSSDVITQAPLRPVIVQVEGNRGDGFTVFYANGTSISPPTDSEALAECSEYDSALDRARCRVEVRTWYRDLGDLKKSLAWVRSHR